MTEATTADSVDTLLLSNFVHQIINPLNGVIGTLDNVIDGTVPAGRRERRLIEVRAQLEHAVDLIRNLAYLSFLSLESGEDALREKTQDCAVTELLIQSVLYYQETAHQSRVRVEVSDPESQYFVKGHPDLLRQVFMNLIENAVKYSDPETVVRIETRIQKKTGDLLVEVVNQGLSFKNAESERLFQLGERGEEAKKRVASGSGIGLFISKRIVERIHAGGITAVHSASDRQSTFTVRLPDAREGKPYVK